MKLTHLDENGAAHMVNIGAKPVTQREAVAQSVLTMQPETLRMILDGTAPKGDVFACARIAGIMAAKRTAELIPMCHPIPIESVDIAIEAVSETQVRVVSTLRCSHKTGIEMEALTAASVAALTVYDMCKAVDRGMRIDETLLLHKTGGKSAMRPISVLNWSWRTTDRPLPTIRAFRKQSRLYVICFRRQSRKSASERTITLPLSRAGIVMTRTACGSFCAASCRAISV